MNLYRKPISLTTLSLLGREKIESSGKHQMHHQHERADEPGGAARVCDERRNDGRSLALFQECDFSGVQVVNPSNDLDFARRFELRQHGAVFANISDCCGLP